MRVLVTGGSGFVGSHLLPHLKRLHEVYAPSRQEMNCLSGDSLDLIGNIKPDCIVHLAARVGGIGANQDHPADFIRDNAQMALSVVDAAWRWRVPRIVCLGSVCAYPKYAPIPFREEDLWNGYPEETNAPYGIAKRLLLETLKAYKLQHGLSYAYLIPTNLYGPGDHYDPRTSHVIPALIRRFKLNDDLVRLWGSGRASRDFLYVFDCVEAIVLAVDGGCEGPFNLGSGQEVTIGALAEIVKRLTGSQARIEWDLTKPDGQPRRCLDSSRAEKYLHWRATTSLEDGLRRTLGMPT